MKYALVALSLAAALVAGCRVDRVRPTGDGGPVSPDRVNPAGDGSITDSPNGDVQTTDAPEGDAPAGEVNMGTPLAPLGAACMAATDCASGLCVDGICCDSPCSGSCEACDRQDRKGTCSPITGAPRGGRAPCTGQGTACAGSCDGMDGSRCAYPGSDQECAAGKCTAGVATTRSVCNGAGACLPGAEVSCAPFTCDGAICAGGCGVGRPCAAGSFCDGGRCFPVKASGDGLPHARRVCQRRLRRRPVLQRAQAAAPARPARAPAAPAPSCQAWRIPAPAAVIASAPQGARAARRPAAAAAAPTSAPPPDA